MLYSDEYLAGVKRGVLMRLCVMLALIAAVVGVLAAACVFRWQVAMYVIAGVGFASIMFLWSMKLTPWLRYWKFMNDMVNGQKRTVEVTFVYATPETRFFDGVEVHDFVTRVGDKEEDERLYVFDADKPLPDYKEGQKLKVTSYGNFVVGIEAC